MPVTFNPIKFAPLNKYLKRITMVFFTLVVVYVGLRIYLNYIFKQVVIEQVEQFADKNYKLELDKIDIGWWAYNANIIGLKLSKIKNKKSEDDKFHFTISAIQVNLKGLYLFDLLFNQKLDLRKLEIKDPNISIYYNDTLVKASKVDSSFNFIKFKLSKIELRNVNINLVKSSGEITKLKGQLIDYSFKNELLQLKKINFDSKNSSYQNFDFTVYLNDALLKGFDLNILINASDFSYEACNFDTLRMNLIEQHDQIAVQEKGNSTTKKSDRKSTVRINPIVINHLYFSSYMKYDTIIASAHHFNYNNHDFSVENIKLKFRQQHDIEAQMEKLAIKGFDVDDFIEKKHGKVMNLKIIKPSMQIDLMIQKNYAQNHIKSNESIGYRIDKIETFEIEGGNLSLKNHQQKNLKIDVNSIQLVAKNINPNSFENGHYHKLLSQLTFSTGRAFINFPSNLYHLQLNSIKYNLNTATLTTQDLSIYQNGKKKEFHAKVKKQIAMINLDLKTLLVSGLNLNNLLRENKFSCREINATKLRVTFYKDKNIPLLASDYKKFPQELFRDIAYPMAINKIKINDATLVSEILNPGASNVAKISVTKVQAELNHIDNQLYVGNQMHVNFEGKIADAGLLKATAMIDMYASDFKHTVHADIGRMPFNYLNDFMIDFASVEINKGILDKAVIDITGNNKNLHCKLDLSYHDLNMDILKNPNKKNKRYRNVASILANSIIYNHNPEPGKPLRKADVKQDYISNKFVVGNWINISLKAMLITTAPAAANALQMNNSVEITDSTQSVKSANWLKRFIQRKRAK
jgi:hypothetical protein